MEAALRARLAALGAAPAQILLPADEIDLTRWSCVACDQYSAQPEYWEEVAAFVGDAPSSLALMMPEAWLGKRPAHAAAIPATMQRYLSERTLVPQGEGMVFLHRQTTAGVRRGLVLALDLEQYEFSAGAHALIRATEQTVVDRLPPRIAIRREAPLEMPHIMVLLDDRAHRLMSLLDRVTAGRRPRYDFPLMQNSGRLKGWLLREEQALGAVADALSALRERAADGMLYAMGDGNHSFAAAKAHWDALRPTLSPAQRETHPARWALAELVDLYDPALTFEPIHRLLMHVDPAAVQREVGFDVADPPPLQELQPALDAWLAGHPEAELEYIHGRADCLRLGAAPDRLAIVWEAFSRDTLFADVARRGVLCRKSFSMGAAADKRFYLECRRIR